MTTTPPPFDTPLSVEPYSTCEISDALVKLGIKTGGYLPDIISRVGSSESSDAERRLTPPRICGPAYTVKMVLASDKTSPVAEGHFVDCAPRGSIIVVSAPTQVKSAVWGGLMTAGARTRGCLGVVLDGRCRDLNEHRQVGFPVFSRGLSTLGQGGFTRPSELNVPLTISGAFDEALGPVTVHPGDIVVADADGVVCVPKEMVEDVAERCERGREIDEKCLAGIQAGKGIAETFKLHRG